ncbi:MAG TPA: carboxypeptidase-like regulatory domain-containing protein, partial [Terracidiphilus sp.]|nr:carboxypeptidase-like regulatory domain-containing protein [Terracidiphilus sp.]
MRSTSRFDARRVFPAVLLLLACGLLHAQKLNGALRGLVEDSTGARVTGARVVAQDAATSFSRATTTDAQGQFLLEGLLPGSYRVTVTAHGFAQATAAVPVALSLTRDLRVTLKATGHPETVNVEGNPSSITTATLDFSSTARGGVVSSQDLEAFPL